MTAVVAILNKQSVAMAADSAVTTGDQKIFNTVNKLFALSKNQPVGIMVYNSAEVMSVPVETLIKEYRRQRDSENINHEHLQGYAEDFESFLRNDTSVFEDEGRREALLVAVQRMAYAIYQRTRKALRKKTGWGHPTRAEGTAALSKVLKEIERSISHSQPITIADPVITKATISAEITNEVEKAVQWLSRVFPTTPQIEAQMRQMLVEHLYHGFDFGGQTGFVVAGFGTKDIFPRLHSFEFHFSVFGLHKVSDRDQSEIDHNLVAELKAFAQRDVMMTFMKGIDPSYHDMIDEWLDGYFTEHIKSLKSSNATNEAVKAARLLGDRLRRALEAKLPKMSNDMFTTPTMQVVASMPKEELAILAEALINLTALKRKASQDAETVGGPTDVAVISKGDGFVWIKRKHYFDMKYNPDFVKYKLLKGGSSP